MNDLPSIVLAFSEHVCTASGSGALYTVNCALPMKSVSTYCKRIRLHGPLKVTNCINFVLNLIESALNCALDFSYTRIRSIREPICCIRSDEWRNVSPDMTIVGRFVCLYKSIEAILNFNSHLPSIAVCLFDQQHLIWSFLF